MLSNCGAGEDSRVLWKENKEIKSVNLKENQPWILWKDWCWSWSSNTSATWCEQLIHWKRHWWWKDWRQEKRATEDEIVGEHHWFNGHELGQTPGDGEGQGSLVCCSPWGHVESDMTWWLNNNNTDRLVCIWVVPHQWESPDYVGEYLMV